MPVNMIGISVSVFGLAITSFLVWFFWIRKKKVDEGTQTFIDAAKSKNLETMSAAMKKAGQNLERTAVSLEKSRETHKKFMKKERQKIRAQKMKLGKSEGSKPWWARRGSWAILAPTALVTILVILKFAGIIN